MSETPTGNRFEQSVADLIRSCGFVAVRGGWPDYAIFNSSGWLVGVAEAKAEGDTIRPMQHLMLQELAERVATWVVCPWNQAEFADWLFNHPLQVPSPPLASALVGKYNSHPPSYVRFDMQWDEKTKTKPRRSRGDIQRVVSGHRYGHGLPRAMMRRFLLNGRLIPKAAAL